MKSAALFLGFSFFILFACKNDPSSMTSSDNRPDSLKTTTSSADVEDFEKLDHDFNITPEGSRLFFKGFFQNRLTDAAMTINKGTLHIAGGVISRASFNLDLRTIEMIANRNEGLETFMKGSSAFNMEKFPNGSFVMEECIKAVNDQDATHIIKGKLQLRGETIPVNVRARIDYRPKYITILTDQIVIKSSDLGIKVADPSQENIYFSLTVNGELF